MVEEKKVALIKELDRKIKNVKNKWEADYQKAKFEKRGKEYFIAFEKHTLERVFPYEVLNSNLERKEKINLIKWKGMICLPDTQKLEWLEEYKVERKEEFDTEIVKNCNLGMYQRRILQAFDKLRIECEKIRYKKESFQLKSKVD